jgi:hypothetical protein
VNIESISEAFAEALDRECGIRLPELEAQVEGEVVAVTWHGVEVARWEGHDPEDPLDPVDVADELLGGMRSPRQDAVDAALEVVGRELPGAAEAARAALRRAEADEALAEALAVELEDAGDLGRARHWTTDAELDHGWPELVVRLELCGEERTVPFTPEQHPHALDTVEVAGAAEELAAAVLAPLLWPGEDAGELAEGIERRLEVLPWVEVHLDPDYPTAITDAAFQEELRALLGEDLAVTPRLEAFVVRVHPPERPPPAEGPRLG